MTPEALYTATIAQAVTLDPEAIRATIYDTAGPSMGGSGEPVSGGGIGDPTASAAIANLTGNRPDDTADVAKLERAVSVFVGAHATIWHACHSGRPGRTWEQAVHEGNMLAELGMVGDAMRTGARISSAIYAAHDAVTTVQRIHDGHCAHVPDGSAKLMTGDPICLSHARIGAYEEGRHGAHHVCQYCYKMLALIGNPSELHHDPDAWPSVEMLREHAEMVRTGRRTAYQRERQLWLEQRQMRRTA